MVTPSTSTAVSRPTSAEMPTEPSSLVDISLELILTVPRCALTPTRVAVTRVRVISPVSAATPIEALIVESLRTCPPSSKTTPVVSGVGAKSTTE